ncbi:MAG: CRISPR-associated helicase Cas3' [Oscillatoriales cyanobacterium SM2_1_8]|nr:CRISPR-associated helicase Cas3' [Oscillatoriales cyanobacterium SM2_1_8]
MSMDFWAKTGQGKWSDNGQPEYHPVICHLIDTAAVARTILDSYLSEAAIARLAEGLGLSGESLIRWGSFLAGSHDLGKVCPSFQFQVPEVGKVVVGGELYEKYRQLSELSGFAPHGTVTAKTLPEFLKELGMNSRLAKHFAAIAGGHHGFFPTFSELQNLNSNGMGDEPKWNRFRREVYQQLCGHAGLTVGDLPSQCSNGAAMILAGLTTTADWIASNSEFFPYAKDVPLGEYVAELPSKVAKALRGMGWQKPIAGECLPFEILFGGFQPRPLQEEAIALSKNLAPPCLVLIEAAMGEGKTEAALYLADCFQHSSGTGGFYIGLPTMATSNAMFARVGKFLAARYPKNMVNLTLSHSAAALQTEYLQSQCRLDQVYDDEGQGKVIASEWHAARKRSLLSPYGVGTLDQGLMGVVRSRHQFVRLFGLAGRTAIMDEIHAYDLYTSTLLERLLEWLAALGSPAIALSATLPQATRRRLLSAYARGCGGRVHEVPEVNYPRITAYAANAVQTRTFAASPHVCRTLGIHWVSEPAWMAQLPKALAGGGCAAVICSTVGRSQAIYQQLQAYFPPAELGLFHGRFLFGDRERIEKDCLAKFSKEGNARPAKFVLVATQVIEQSLDVDFDVMVTDMAPMDLLLQRSGRLHRHGRSRPPNLQKPTLWLIRPTIASDGKVAFAESGFIYDRHILLRTWLALRDRDRLDLPSEMDRLIELAYDLEMPIPEELEAVHREDWQKSQGSYRQDSAILETQAEKVRIPPAIKKADMELFTRIGSDDDESTLAAVTRLGQESITVVFLAKDASGALVLPSDRRPVDTKQPLDLETIRRLLACSTRISKPGLVPWLQQHPARPANWRSALLRNCACVVVDADGAAIAGTWRLVLDPKLGVCIEKNQEEP